MGEALTLEEIRLLAALRADASVRAAAAALSLTRSTLSRKLVALETRLGQEVFLRRGRQLLPTRFGEVLLERAEEAQTALDQAQAAAEGSGAGGPRLTIAASPLFAEIVLPRVLPALLAQRPTLGIELRLSHEYSDLFEGGVDVALRRGPIPDSASLNARRLGRMTMVCVVARGFPLPGPGLPPEELARRLPWVRVGARLEPFTLHLRAGRQPRPVVLAPRVAVDHQRLALELARQGVGAARVNAFLIRDELASGELVEVLPEARSSEDTFAVYPRRRQPESPVRDLLTHLLAACRALQVWD